MKKYWQNLNDREQKMLVIAGVFTVLYLTYLLLFAPIIKAVDNKKNQLSLKKETLSWLEQAQKQQHETVRQKKLSNSQLLTLLSHQLKANKLVDFPHQIEQTGSGDIQISFDSVPFKNIFQWLEQLNKGYTVQIKQLNVERKESPGTVKLTLVITAS